MNAKYALALILALQVSTSLCEFPTPSQDLVETYDTMRATFYKRVLILYSKLQNIFTPFVSKAGESTGGQAARDYIEELQSKPEFQTFIKVATGLGEEAGPLVEKVRLAALALYEKHLRPHIGEYVNGTIKEIQVLLDQVLPVQ